MTTDDEDAYHEEPFTCNTGPQGNYTSTSKCCQINHLYTELEVCQQWQGNQNSKVILKILKREMVINKGNREYYEC